MGYQAERALSSHGATVPVLVIPTAPLVREPSNQLTEIIEGASSLAVSEEEAGVGVESVLPFVETPAPQVLGHHSRPDPELFFSKTPSVARFITCMYSYYGGQ